MVAVMELYVSLFPWIWLTVDGSISFISDRESNGVLLTQFDISNTWSPIATINNGTLVGMKGETSTGTSTAGDIK